MRHLLTLILAPLLLCCSAAADDGPEPIEETYGEVQAAPLTGSPTKYPIILVHGVNSSPTKLGFYKVDEALRADGHVVFVASLSPYKTPEIRARDLQETVDLALRSAGKVNIIAHSTGGLDARELISKLGYGDRVASLTTISSPHGGSYIGDVMGGLVPDGPVDDVVNALASAWGRTFTADELANGSELHAAFVSMSEKAAPAFNATHRNDSRVYYQSWAGVSTRIGIGNSEDRDVCEGLLEGNTDVLAPSLQALSLVAGHGFGMQSSFQPNDGMITVQSAKLGNFRGCIRADHLDEVGQSEHDHANLRTKFDHRRFYRGIAFELASMAY